MDSSVISKPDVHQTPISSIKWGEVKRLDLYEMAYDLQEKKAKLPRIFAKEYFHKVPSKVLLTDPVGHDMSIYIIKDEENVYFVEGWHYLGAYYGIQSGGWVRMFYVAPGHFSIHVFNRWGDPVSYPYKMECAEKGNSSDPILLEEEDDVIEQANINGIVDLSKCISECKKWLSYQEMVGSKLNFGRTWTSYALPQKDCKLTVVDEYGDSWPCFFKFDIKNPDNSGIVQGWSTFCRNKKLYQGQCVKFAVLTTQSKILYFTPTY